tara:strand:+ start:756 stop:1028 length:273 start_codon:yes stop_codon:yes gene_type:complete
VANGHVQAEHLLQLELDGGLDVVDLIGEVIGGENEGGELARLVETRTQQTRNLLDERLRRDELVVLLGCATKERGGGRGEGDGKGESGDD